ncbi:MAG: lipocalin family protein [Cyclobacteriaceae bacterium]|nr:lipocalin family protein [Cyclobacteriaceae bacterium]
MKKLYSAFIGVTVISFVLFNACTPEDVIVEDLSAKLTKGSWTFNSVEAGSAFLNSGYEITYEGNVITFNGDGTSTDKLLGINGNGTWSLSGNQDELTLRITYDDSDTRNEVWQIISITDTALRYKFDIAPNTLEMTYTH